MSPTLYMAEVNYLYEKSDPQRFTGCQHPNITNRNYFIMIITYLFFAVRMHFRKLYY